MELHILKFYIQTYVEYDIYIKYDNHRNKLWYCMIQFSLELIFSLPFIALYRNLRVIGQDFFPKNRWPRLIICIDLFF